MPERRLSTLADAQRQGRVRGFIGGLLIVLALLFLLFFVVKHFYLNLPHDLFLSEQGKDLRKFIDSLLGAWAVLALLWRAIPPWQPIHPLPTTPLWDYVSVVWGTIVVGFIGGLLRWNARTRRTEIMEYYRESQHEAQAISHEYAVPPESWSQMLWGILIPSLIVALGSGLILFYAEYAFFQAFQPSGRN
jgi:hypothetical protein